MDTSDARLLQVTVRLQAAYRARADRARRRDMCLAAVKDILPERTVFVPASFALDKLPIILNILKSDERRICMLFEQAAVVLLEHQAHSTGTIPFSQDGDSLVLFDHTYPDVVSGSMSNLSDLTPIKRDRIRALFEPVAIRPCVVCTEDTIMDVHNRLTNTILYPYVELVPPDQVPIFQCTGCLSVVCNKCHVQYFKQTFRCPTCRRFPGHELLMANAEKLASMTERLGPERVTMMTAYVLARCVAEGLNHTNSS